MSAFAEQAASDVYLGCQCDVFGWGGALSSALGLAHALSASEITPLLLGVSSGQPMPSRSVRNVRRMNLRMGETGAGWRVANWLRAKRIARELRLLPAPRLAFVANSPFWALAARRAWPRTRVIYRFPCLLSHCLPFTWPPNRPRTTWERVDFVGLRRAERAAFERSEVTWAATAANQAEIVEFAPRAEQNVLRVMFGHRAIKIDPEKRQLVRAERSIEDDAFVILVGGVCDRNKAFELAIDALPELPEQCVLVIAGDGERRPALEKHAAKLGVKKRTHFVGVQRDIAPWLAAADVVVSTSFYDANPNLIREAVAAGVPVVLPRHDPPRVYAGLADFIAEREAGLLYEHGDSASLADAITTLIDPEVAGQLSTAGQQAAQREFRWDECVRQITGA